MADNLSQPGGNPKAPPPAGRSAPTHSHWGTWLIVIIIFLLLIPAWFLLRKKPPQQPPSPSIPISVTNVVQGDIAVAVSALGSVQPVYTATMSPRVDGQMMSVNYTEGQMVGSNDLLAVIDPGPYQAQLTAATGQLERDNAVLAGAKVNLERFQAAFAKQAIPKQQLDDQIALVQQDEGAVKVDEGQATNAQVNLNYCYIRAPFAGRVGLRAIDPGNVVHAANTNAIVVVAQLQPITVVFNVAEDYLPQIQQQLQGGNDMVVEAWDRANEHRIATGKVLALNNLIDTATGTIRIKATFENEDLSLFPNQFVNARLVIQILHDQNLIPTFAVQRNPEGSFVYVVTNGIPTTNSMANAASANAKAPPPGTNTTIVSMRNITTGTVDGNTTAVTKGLEPGDVIAVDNFNKLGEGVKVVPGKSEEGETPNGGGHKKGGGQHKSKPEGSKDSQ